MNLRSAIVIGLASLTPFFSLRSETDAEVDAHESALDLAGAFSNDGFKIRDGHWAGIVKPGEKVVVAVNLYAGNQYWFIVGAVEKAKKVAVEIFDENGKPMKTEPYESDNRGAAGFSPTTSGQYFVSLGLQDGEPATACLIYSYK